MPTEEAYGMDSTVMCQQRKTATKTTIMERKTTIGAGKEVGQVVRVGSTSSTPSKREANWKLPVARRSETRSRGRSSERLMRIRSGSLRKNRRRDSTAGSASSTGGKRRASGRGESKTDQLQQDQPHARTRGEPSAGSQVARSYRFGPWANQPLQRTEGIGEKWMRVNSSCACPECETATP
ncbi:hypothetical protein G6O67_002351 [Ophiocordyceps sinensis]|uniref:Uncharacterized protein n=1 Tax=Ophiocordyceps sinensis TaxID=72228 RepID=A0A8H4V770_9HYPO|nr:hypothetical protein G6O67_002351 [Ophiocordyceps sinensis]